MDGIAARMPPGEGLTRPAAVTRDTTGASLSSALYYSTDENANTLTPEQVRVLHRVYAFILSW